MPKMTRRTLLASAGAVALVNINTRPAKLLSAAGSPDNRCCRPPGPSGTISPEAATRINALPVEDPA
jgi:hypothetical protein